MGTSLFEEARSRDAELLGAATRLSVLSPTCEPDALAAEAGVPNWMGWSLALRRGVAGRDAEGELTDRSARTIATMAILRGVRGSEDLSEAFGCSGQEACLAAARNGYLVHEGLPGDSPEVASAIEAAVRSYPRGFHFEHAMLAGVSEHATMSYAYSHRRLNTQTSEERERILAAVFRDPMLDDTAIARLTGHLPEGVAYACSQHELETMAVRMVLGHGMDIGDAAWELGVRTPSLRSLLIRRGHELPRRRTSDVLRDALGFPPAEADRRVAV